MELEKAKAVETNKGTRVSTWIKSDKQLPTHHHSVLGYVVGGGLVTDDPMIDIVSYGGKDDPRWLQFIGDAGDQVVAVSHWMPLPEEPSQ